jgi:serine protease Do
MVQVDEFPSDEKIASLERKRNIRSDKSNRIGLALRELSDSEKKQLEINNGLLVEDLRQGIASRSGIRPGDIILGLNNQDATTVGQFNQVLNKIRKGRNIALLVRRGNTTSFITMMLNGDESK